MSEIVIVGAGPGGLTAAYELTRAGVKSTVLEADRAIGGLSRTVTHNGYRFDIGGHRFFSKSEPVNQIWREILTDEFLLRPRLSRIHYRQRYFAYPLQPLDALTGLGLVEAARVGLSWAKAKVLPDRDEKTFEQWVCNRFGRRLFEIFFQTYTEKVWGIPCSQISADWAVQRIRNLSLGEALRNALLSRSRDSSGEIITSLIDEFHYPRLGPGMMWERCAEIVESRGVRVQCGERVERIHHRDRRVTSVVTRNERQEAGEFAVDQLISTMALRDLVRAMDPPPPVEVLRAAEALRYRDYLTVVLVVKRAEVFPDNWIYIHSPEVRMGRIQNYKNWSPDMVPDASRTALGLEYFLWDRDPEWEWSHERLIELGLRECVQIGMVEPGEVEDGTVVRMPAAYPVYDHAYRDNVATIRGWLETIENLQTVGRNGQHRYNNQDHSMLGGLLAARNLLGEKNDVWAVNTDAEYLEGPTSKPAGRAATGDRMTPETVLPDELLQEVLARLDPLALGVAFGAVFGLGLLVATVGLLLKGGEEIGPNLSLLAQYLVGYSVSWTGMWVGICEAGLIGLMLGGFTATVRNVVVTSVAARIRKRTLLDQERRLLDDV